MSTHVRSSIYAILGFKINMTMKPYDFFYFLKWRIFPTDFQDIRFLYSMYSVLSLINIISKRKWRIFQGALGYILFEKFLSF